jgi:hypothetical protein
LSAVTAGFATGTGFSAEGPGFSAGGLGFSAEGAVAASADDTFEGVSAGTAGAGGTTMAVLEAASDVGAGADSRRGAGAESRRGLGGGANRRDAVGGTEPGPLVGGTDPGTLGSCGAASLPGSDAGGGIDGVRMSGLVGAPGGRLGVPTETTGTLGILGGGGTLSEVSALAATSASSPSELFGFEVMRA